MGNMNNEEKAKLGKTGSKISSDGSHKVVITGCYQGEYDGKPNIAITFNEDGRDCDWTGYLTATVGKDNDGKVKAGMYSVNGVQTQLNNEGDVYDNLKTVGHIKNLCEICGTTLEAVGASVTEGMVKSFGKDIQAPIYNGLIGKSLTIVTSYQISADKDPKKPAWRNQVVSMENLFDINGLSKLELANGKTEPVAIDGAIKLSQAPAAQYADIGYSIKYKDLKNANCITELKLIANGANKKAPVLEVVADDDDAIFN